jgi:hypothetical protein
VWYTLERANHIWTVWKNKEQDNENHGGYGSSRIYSSFSKDDCLDFCKENKIKIEKRK